MALETECLTPGANFSTSIGTKYISCRVTLPFELKINRDETKTLERLIHNQMELVLRSYFDGWQG